MGKLSFALHERQTKITLSLLVPDKPTDNLIFAKKVSSKRSTV